MSIYFFFSSRRRHTRCSRDWSSDVCSSDLIALVFSDHRLPDGSFRGLLNHVHSAGRTPPVVLTTGDRKSTRLNSSHGYISYAVFCLKKKKRATNTLCLRNPSQCNSASR